LEKLATISLNGTVVFPKPRWYWAATRDAAPRHGAKTPVSDGLIPDGRKKLSNAAGANTPAGPLPQVATFSGLELGATAPAATARSQFSISAFELVGLALIGRFRWCPPV